MQRLCERDLHLRSFKIACVILVYSQLWGSDKSADMIATSASASSFKCLRVGNCPVCSVCPRGLQMCTSHVLQLANGAVASLLRCLFDWLQRPVHQQLFNLSRTPTTRHPRRRQIARRTCLLAFICCDIFFFMAQRNFLSLLQPWNMNRALWHHSTRAFTRSISQLHFQPLMHF